MVNGTLVHIDNFAEASAYAGVVLAELARVMNTPAKALVIADVQQVEEGLKTPKWQPYTKAAKLIEDRNNMRFYNNKRAQIDGDKDTATQSDKRRAAVTGSGPVNNPTASPNAWHKNPEKSKDNIADLKAEFMEQMEKNNKHIREEIQAVNVATNTRITNIDAKLEHHIYTVQDNLNEIKEQNKDTKSSMESNVSRLENIFWKMWFNMSQNRN
jgi:hypothetical protein